MMLYKTRKVKVHSSDGDTDYFDIVVGVLQGNTSASYLFIICLDYVLRMSFDLMKENSFRLAKERSRRYPAIVLLANTLAQAETLLHSLERAADGIGPHINADKTEYVCFNQKGNISTQKGGPMKLLDKFTYLGNSVPSAEKDINTQLAKAWIAIDRLLVIWKLDLTDKMKRSFFSKQKSCWYCYMDALHGC